jgi:hypothetical protein
MKRSKEKIKGWQMAKNYNNTYSKMYLYRHVGRSLWDMVWIEETQDGDAVAGGIKEGSYHRKESGYGFFGASDYTPEPEDIHHAVMAVFGEL